MTRLGEVFECPLRVFECCGVSTGDLDHVERFALTQGGLGAKSNVSVVTWGCGCAASLVLSTMTMAQRESGSTC